MPILYNFLKGFVISQWWISLGGGFLSYAYFKVFQMDKGWLHAAYIASCIFLLYSFQRLYKIQTNTSNPKRLHWYAKYIHFIYGSIFTALLVVGFASFYLEFTLDYLLVNLLMGILAVAYIVPIFGLPLRKIPVLKIFLVAFVWTFFLFLPTDFHWNQFDFKWMGLMVLFFIAITIPFDIRDYRLDSLSMKTIPQMVGVNYAKWLAVSLMIMVYFGLHFLIPQHFGSLIWLMIFMFFLFQKKIYHAFILHSLVFDGMILYLGLALYCIS